MFIALPCVNHSPCILSYERLWSSIKHEMPVAADQSPAAATNTSIYYTSYTVGNVSLGLAHGMEGILHVVTVARDNTKVERHRRFA
jgi:hypothetical protein